MCDEIVDYFKIVIQQKSKILKFAVIVRNLTENNKLKLY